MKIIQINSTCGNGSTGKICSQISKMLSDIGVQNLVLYSQGNSYDKNSIKIGFKLYYKLQALKKRLLGNEGFNSHISTSILIKKIKSYNPDIVHIHNIHSNDVNFAKLFSFLKKRSIKVFYTFHDCWALTGYCTHFAMVGCYKWKKNCFKCIQKRKYSWIFDQSKILQEKKRKALQGLDLTIITPSKWLAELVKQTFLKEYPVEVINNGIDLLIFKPTQSDFRKRYNIPKDKYILLGVAFGWEENKGLDVFIELSKRLDKNKFQIVLVGTNDGIDKQLPSGIVSIHRTQNQQQLAEIYSSADVFFNPTREDNYPTVNMEALACGCPVVTFDTGGSPEIIDNKTGIVVPVDDIESSIKAIKDVCENKVINREDCIARAKSFDLKSRFIDYINLYKINEAKD